MKKELTESQKKAAKVVKCALAIPFAIAIFNRGDRVEQQAVVTESKPIVTSAKPRSQSFNLAVLPEYCTPEHQRLTLQTYELCIHEGMSYVQVGNVIGNPGTNKAKSGNAEVWGWGGNGPYGGEGYMSVSFVNGKMTSKSQSGLPSDPNMY